MSKKRGRYIGTDVNPDTWSSASSVHNYMLDDPILDYFSRYKCHDLSQEKEKDKCIFFKFILEKGINFERAIMYYIKHTLKIDYKQISYNREDSLLYEKYEETIKSIKKRVPLIYQGVLHDSVNKTYGTPDIIIRKDILNKLVPNTLENEDLFDLDTYAIIDIKFTSLDLSVDGIHLLNSGRARANKGQIILYNRMLNIVLSDLGLDLSDKCYVLGRGYKITKTRTRTTSKSNNCFEKLGHIEPFDHDSDISEKLNGALKWLSDLKENGSNWSLENSINLRPELRPNMCNTYDAPFTSLKKKVALEQEEITLLCNVSYKNRMEALLHDIFKISDEELTTDILLLNKSPRTDLIQKIIEMNKLGNKDIIRPRPKIDKISNETMEFFNNSSLIEFYIDFETVNVFDSFDKLYNGLPEIGHHSYTVMIGLIVRSYKYKTDSYYNFIASEISIDAEYKIFKDMLELVNKLCLSANVDPCSAKFYHWSQIEQCIYKNISKKSGLEELQKLNFCDALEFFRKEPFLIKGMYNFSLKTVGFAFIKNNLFGSNNPDISSWTDEVASGLDASILLEQYYKNIPESNKILADIIKYNKVDCSTILHIVDFIRENY